MRFFPGIRHSTHSHLLETFTARSQASTHRHGMVCPLISSFSFLLFVVSDALMRTFVLILFVVAAGTMIGGIARSVAAAPKVASVEDAGALANQVYNRLEAPVLDRKSVV